MVFLAHLINYCNAIHYCRLHCSDCAEIIVGTFSLSLGHCSMRRTFIEISFFLPSLPFISSTISVCRVVLVHDHFHHFFFFKCVSFYYCYAQTSCWLKKKRTLPLKYDENRTRTTHTKYSKRNKKKLKWNATENLIACRSRKRPE